MVFNLIAGWRTLQLGRGERIDLAENESAPIGRPRRAEPAMLMAVDVRRRPSSPSKQPAALKLFTSLERALANPTDDTATVGPVRPVPRR